MRVRSATRYLKVIDLCIYECSGSNHTVLSTAAVSLSSVPGTLSLTTLLGPTTTTCSSACDCSSPGSSLGAALIHSPPHVSNHCTLSLVPGAKKAGKGRVSSMLGEASGVGECPGA
jgi:hypothetical protein